MRLIIIGFLLLNSLNLQAEEVKTFKDYKIKTGDILNIIVIPPVELSKEVIVQKDGNINIQLIGKIKAEGLSLKELAELIEKELIKYVTGPLVTVTLKEFGTRKVSIMGQVKSPGGYDFRDGLRILELLSICGGFTNDGDLTAVKIFRGKDPKTVIEVNMEDVIDRGDMKKNIEIEVDDIVYIPQKALSAFNWFLGNIFPVLTLVSTLLTLYLVVK
ncbi:MAG: polysaccharide biosynthesis/export family protein [Candidatus Firestonebacteria bacterium]